MKISFLTATILNFFLYFPYNGSQEIIYLTDEHLSASPPLSSSDSHTANQHSSILRTKENSAATDDSNNYDVSTDRLTSFSGSLLKRNHSEIPQDTMFNFSTFVFSVPNNSSSNQNFVTFSYFESTVEDSNQAEVSKSNVSASTASTQDASAVSTTTSRFAPKFKRIQRNKFVSGENSISTPESMTNYHYMSDSTSIPHFETDSKATQNLEHVFLSTGISKSTFVPISTVYAQNIKDEQLSASTNENIVMSNENNLLGTDYNIYEQEIGPLFTDTVIRENIDDTDNRDNTMLEVPYLDDKNAITYMEKHKKAVRYAPDIPLKYNYIVIDGTDNNDDETAISFQTSSISSAKYRNEFESIFTPTNYDKPNTKFTRISAVTDDSALNINPINITNYFLNYSILDKNMNITNLNDTTMIKNLLKNTMNKGDLTISKTNDVTSTKHTNPKPLDSTTNTYINHKITWLSKDGTIIDNGQTLNMEDFITSSKNNIATKNEYKVDDSEIKFYTNTPPQKYLKNNPNNFKSMKTYATENIITMSQEMANMDQNDGNVEEVIFLYPDTSTTEIRRKISSFNSDADYTQTEKSRIILPSDNTDTLNTIFKYKIKPTTTENINLINNRHVINPTKISANYVKSGTNADRTTVFQRDNFQSNPTTTASRTHLETDGFIYFSEDGEADNISDLKFSISPSEKSTDSVYEIINLSTNNNYANDVSTLNSEAGFQMNNNYNFFSVAQAPTIITKARNNQDQISMQIKDDYLTGALIAEPMTENLIIDDVNTQNWETNNEAADYLDIPSEPTFFTIKFISTNSHNNNYATSLHKGARYITESSGSIVNMGNMPEGRSTAAMTFMPATRADILTSRKTVGNLTYKEMDNIEELIPYEEVQSVIEEDSINIKDNLLPSNNFENFELENSHFGRNGFVTANTIKSLSQLSSSTPTANVKISDRDLTISKGDNFNILYDNTQNDKIDFHSMITEELINNDLANKGKVEDHISIPITGKKLHKGNSLSAQHYSINSGVYNPTTFKGIDKTTSDQIEFERPAWFYLTDVSKSPLERLIPEFQEEVNRRNSNGEAEFEIFSDVDIPYSEMEENGKDNFPHERKPLSSTQDFQILMKKNVNPTLKNTVLLDKDTSHKDHASNNYEQAYPRAKNNHIAKSGIKISHSGVSPVTFSSSNSFEDINLATEYRILGEGSSLYLGNKNTLRKYSVNPILKNTLLLDKETSNTDYASNNYEQAYSREENKHIAERDIKSSHSGILPMTFSSLDSSEDINLATEYQIFGAGSILTTTLSPHTTVAKENKLNNIKNVINEHDKNNYIYISNKHDFEQKKKEKNPIKKYIQFPHASREFVSHIDNSKAEDTKNLPYRIALSELETKGKYQTITPKEENSGSALSSSSFKDSTKNIFLKTMDTSLIDEDDLISAEYLERFSKGKNTLNEDDSIIISDMGSKNPEHIFVPQKAKNLVTRAESRSFGAAQINPTLRTTVINSQGHFHGKGTSSNAHNTAAPEMADILEENLRFNEDKLDLNEISLKYHINALAQDTVAEDENTFYDGKVNKGMMRTASITSLNPVNAIKIPPTDATIVSLKASDFDTKENSKNSDSTMHKVNDVLLEKVKYHPTTNQKNLRTVIALNKNSDSLFDTVVTSEISESLADHSTVVDQNWEVIKEQSNTNPLSMVSSVPIMYITNSLQNSMNVTNTTSTKNDGISDKTDTMDFSYNIVPQAVIHKKGSKSKTSNYFIRNYKNEELINTSNEKISTPGSGVNALLNKDKSVVEDEYYFSEVNIPNNLRNINVKSVITKSPISSTKQKARTLKETFYPDFTVSTIKLTKTRDEDLPSLDNNFLQQSLSFYDNLDGFTIESTLDPEHIETDFTAVSLSQLDSDVITGDSSIEVVDDAIISNDIFGLPDKKLTVHNNIIKFDDTRSTDRYLLTERNRNTFQKFQDFSALGKGILSESDIIILPKEKGVEQTHASAPESMITARESRKSRGEIIDLTMTPTLFTDKEQLHKKGILSPFDVFTEDKPIPLPKSVYNQDTALKAERYLLQDSTVPTVKSSVKPDNQHPFVDKNFANKQSKVSSLSLPIKTTDTMSDIAALSFGNSYERDNFLKPDENSVMVINFPYSPSTEHIFEPNVLSKNPVQMSGKPLMDSSVLSETSNENLGFITENNLSEIKNIKIQNNFNPHSLGSIVYSTNSLNSLKKSTDDEADLPPILERGTTDISKKPLGKMMKVLSPRQISFFPSETGKKSKFSTDFEITDEVYLSDIPNSITTDFEITDEVYLSDIPNSIIPTLDQTLPSIPKYSVLSKSINQEDEAGNFVSGHSRTMEDHPFSSKVNSSFILQNPPTFKRSLSTNSPDALKESREKIYTLPNRDTDTVGLLHSASFGTHGEKDHQLWSSNLNHLDIASESPYKYSEFDPAVKTEIYSTSKIHNDSLSKERKTLSYNSIPSPSTNISTKDLLKTIFRQKLMHRNFIGKDMISQREAIPTAEYISDTNFEDDQILNSEDMVITILDDESVGYVTDKYVRKPQWGKHNDVTNKNTLTYDPNLVGSHSLYFRKNAPEHSSLGTPTEIKNEAMQQNVLPREKYSSFNFSASVLKSSPDNLNTKAAKYMTQPLAHLHANFYKFLDNPALQSDTLRGDIIFLEDKGMEYSSFKDPETVVTMVEDNVFSGETFDPIVIAHPSKIKNKVHRNVASSDIYNIKTHSQAENTFSPQKYNVKDQINMKEMIKLWDSFPDNKLSFINKDTESFNNKPSMISYSPTNIVISMDDTTTFSTDNDYEGDESMLPEDVVRSNGFVALQNSRKSLLVPSASTENLEVSEPVIHNSSTDSSIAWLKKFGTMVGKSNSTTYKNFAVKNKMDLNTHFMTSNKHPTDSNSDNLKIKKFDSFPFISREMTGNSKIETYEIYSEPQGEIIKAFSPITNSQHEVYDKRNMAKVSDQEDPATKSYLNHIKNTRILNEPIKKILPSQTESNLPENHNYMEEDFYAIGAGKFSPKGTSTMEDHFFVVNFDNTFSKSQVPSNLKEISSVDPNIILPEASSSNQYSSPKFFTKEQSNIPTGTYGLLARKSTFLSPDDTSFMSSSKYSEFDPFDKVRKDTATKISNISPGGRNTALNGNIISPTSESTIVSFSEYISEEPYDPLFTGEIFPTNEIIVTDMPVNSDLELVSNKFVFEKGEDGNGPLTRNTKLNNDNNLLKFHTLYARDTISEHISQGSPTNIKTSKTYQSSVHKDENSNYDNDAIALKSSAVNFKTGVPNSMTFSLTDSNILLSEFQNENIIEHTDLTGDNTYHILSEDKTRGYSLAPDSELITLGERNMVTGIIHSDINDPIDYEEQFNRKKVSSSFSYNAAPNKAKTSISPIANANKHKMNLAKILRSQSNIPLAELSTMPNYHLPFSSKITEEENNRISMSSLPLKKASSSVFDSTTHSTKANNERDNSMFLDDINAKSRRLSSLKTSSMPIPNTLTKNTEASDLKTNDLSSKSVRTSSDVMEKNIAYADTVNGGEALEMQVETQDDFYSYPWAWIGLPIELINFSDSTTNDDIDSFYFLKESSNTASTNYTTTTGRFIESTLIPLYVLQWNSTFTPSDSTTARRTFKYSEFIPSGSDTTKNSEFSIPFEEIVIRSDQDLTSPVSSNSVKDTSIFMENIFYNNLREREHEGEYKMSFTEDIKNGIDDMYSEEDISPVYMEQIIMSDGSGSKYISNKHDAELENIENNPFTKVNRFINIPNTYMSPAPYFIDTALDSLSKSTNPQLKSKENHQPMIIIQENNLDSDDIILEDSNVNWNFRPTTYFLTETSENFPSSYSDKQSIGKIIFNGDDEIITLSEGYDLNKVIEYPIFPKSIAGSKLSTTDSPNYVLKIRNYFNNKNVSPTIYKTFTPTRSDTTTPSMSDTTEEVTDTVTEFDSRFSNFYLAKLSNDDIYNVNENKEDSSKAKFILFYPLKTMSNNIPNTPYISVENKNKIGHDNLQSSATKRVTSIRLPEDFILTSDDPIKETAAFNLMKGASHKHHSSMLAAPPPVSPESAYVNEDIISEQEDV